LQNGEVIVFRAHKGTKRNYGEIEFMSSKRRKLRITQSQEYFEKKFSNINSEEYQNYYHLQKNELKRSSRDKSLIYLVKD
jgi:hypothetical protein